MKFRDVFKEPIINISNILSITRIICLVPFYYFSETYIAQPSLANLLPILLLCLIAVLSDFFDGFLARRLNQITMFGIYLDPLCDKITAIGSFIVLVRDYSFPLWIFVIYLLREAFAVFFGSYLYFKKDIQGRPNMWGKMGVTVMSVIALWYLSMPWLKTYLPADHLLIKQAHFSGFILILFLVGSMVSYSRRHWQTFFPAKTQS